MAWMINTYDDLAHVNWNYPEYHNDWSIQNADRLSGPYSTYDVLVCASNPEQFSEYQPFDLTEPWLPGTLLGDTVNAGFPLNDTFAKPPQNGYGYTHGEGM
mmetsp:Transcript_19526/g.40449  ORF Transcript_19526/g.40449 Transcript_19526/m.40449 type:complete len:101 (-) Transcript_19526:602-904(-)|eukprot:CAMPEP_0172457128 /NCGR_PEP_ID=MMETSP1065-20121228/20115_1 /TAXON_ID=265537 /ORGANISM="Amphiprora paludosa, Strain CCMP125" /LENGTH=100 /DNA_ID=CAMNT_0013210653 /DNA_START=899 /DNA_END=1201 /DNA_ORIENTATION=+